MIDWDSIIGFDWDHANATKSHDKHGITCAEAESVFFSANLMVLHDEKHSTAKESRWHAFGSSLGRRPLSITFTVRNHHIRVISARPMNARERNTYGYQKP